MRTEIKHFVKPPKPKVIFNIREVSDRARCPAYH